MFRLSVLSVSSCKKSVGLRRSFRRLGLRLSFWRFFFDDTNAREQFELSAAELSESKAAEEQPHSKTWRP